MVSLGEATGNNSLIDVEQLLQNALRDYRADPELNKCKRAIIIFLDDDDCYTTYFMMAKLKLSQAIALLETMKFDMLTQFR